MEYSDDDEFEALFTSLWKPGETIPNPVAGTTGAPATIPDPGVFISGNTVEKFKVG